MATKTQTKKTPKEKTQKQKYNAYLKELVEIFDGFDENKKTVFLPHLENMAWQKVKLEELRSIIDRDGLIEMYQNGENQYGYKPSAAVKTYNDIIKSYNAETKLIEPYIPAQAKVSKLKML